MSTVYLKKLLGEAGAGLDKSAGGDNLYDVLAAIVDYLKALDAAFATIASDSIIGTADATYALDPEGDMINAAKTLANEMKVVLNAVATLSFNVTKE